MKLNPNPTENEICHGLKLTILLVITFSSEMKNIDWKRKSMVEIIDVHKRKN